MFAYFGILVFPLYSSIYCIIYGRCLPFHSELNNFKRYEGIKLISITCSVITCFLSFYVFYQVGFLKNPYYLNFGT
jgi:hypothetical protein